MKKQIKKLVSVLAAAAMSATMMFTVAQAAEEYSSIGLGDMQSVYLKGETAELNIVPLDANGEEVLFDDYGNCTYTSSNENVVTIDELGTMTMRDYGVSTVTVKCGELSASMMVTVTPAKIGEQTFDSEQTSMARRGVGAKEHTVETIAQAKDDGGNVLADYIQANVPSIYWPGEPKMSNMVSEGWFYDNGQTENAEAGIGFKRHENYNNTGAVGVLNSTDTTYRVSNVHGRWDQIWENDIIESRTTDTGIARTKGWHQVTMVQTNPAGNVMHSNGSGNAVSAVFEIYLDGKLVKTGTSTGYQKYQIYGYAGFTVGTTSWFDDAVNTNYMQVNGVELGTDADDGETLVASVDYTGYSGASVAATYQWYYADSADATEWTLIEGATEKSYKPENIAEGNFIKAGVKVTETIDNVNYQTEEYFSDPTFLFDGTYESISLGKSDSYTTKGGTITLKVTGFSKDGIERTISDISEMTFQSSDEQVATVENGVVTAKDYGRTQITAKLGEMTAKMQITVTPPLNTETRSWIADFDSSATTIARRGAGSYAYAGTMNGTNYQTTGLGGWWQGKTRSNAFFETWFYDNGELTDAEAAVGFTAYGGTNSSVPNVGVVGVLKDGDTTYQIANLELNIVFSGRVSSSKDTGIARTPGWHQVTVVQKHPEGEVGYERNNVGFPYDYWSRIREYELYLDGELVDTQVWTSDRFSFMYSQGYAGGDTSHTAYFDDAMKNDYIALEGVLLSVAEDGESLVATPDYYGPNGSYIVEEGGAEFKWYYADSEDAETWTVIEGATEQIYTPDKTTKGKFIKAGVKITDTLDNKNDIKTEERLSDATYVFDGIYNSISLGKSASWLTAKGATAQLVLTGFGGDKLERNITDLTDVTFTSADEQIAIVSADGTVTAVDYGRTQVTAKMGDLETAITITVTPKNVNNKNFDSSATSMSRTGAGAKIVTSIIKKDFVNGDTGAKYDIADNTTLIWNESFVGNGVNEAWFYDSGETENAEIGIAAMGLENRSMMPYVGVINSEDETYHYIQGDERWSNLPISRLTQSYFNKDTGIKRTKGWHQVTFVAMNAESNSKSKAYEIYLDGQLIKTATSSYQPMGIIVANAMANEGNSVWVDDAAQHQYVEIKDVTIAKDETGAMKASYNYYGPIDASMSATYQWSVSEDGKAWTVIEGVTNETYTGEEGKYYNVTVTVTDLLDSTTITTDRVSDAYLLTDTSISYVDGKVIITAGEEISGVIIVAEYETVNGYKTLKSVKTIENITASEGEISEVQTGTLSGTIMLWDSIKTQVPYCDSYEIK